MEDGAGVLDGGDRSSSDRWLDKGRKLWNSESDDN